MTKTLVTGNPVYPPLNFKDVLSYVWTLVLLSLLFFGYLLMTFLSRFKQRKIDSYCRENLCESNAVFNISKLDRSDKTIDLSKSGEKDNEI